MLAVQIPIVEKILRTVLVYATILILFRLTGKRDLATLNMHASSGSPWNRAACWCAFRPELTSYRGLPVAARRARTPGPST
jgi:hypothetical protein